MPWNTVFEKACVVHSVAALLRRRLFSSLSSSSFFRRRRNRRKIDDIDSDESPMTSKATKKRRKKPLRRKRQKHDSVKSVERNVNFESGEEKMKNNDVGSEEKRRRRKRRKNVDVQRYEKTRRRKRWEKTTFVAFDVIVFPPISTSPFFCGIRLRRFFRFRHYFFHGLWRSFFLSLSTSSFFVTVYFFRFQMHSLVTFNVDCTSPFLTSLFSSPFLTYLFLLLFCCSVFVCPGLPRPQWAAWRVRLLPIFFSNSAPIFLKPALIFAPIREVCRLAACGVQ